MHRSTHHRGVPDSSSPPAVAVGLPLVLSGPRLDLVLVSVEQVLSRDSDAGGDSGTRPVPLDYDDPEDVLHPDRSPLAFRIAQLREDASVNPWLIRLAVARETRTIVGLINFHGPPDENGMVEIGYRVLPAHRRQGYAREMAETMWARAARLPGVRVLRATVSPGNSASIAIIEAAGLVHVGEQDDPEDGLELIYEITAAAYRARSTQERP